MTAANASTFNKHHAWKGVLQQYPDAYSEPHTVARVRVLRFGRGPQPAGCDARTLALLVRAELTGNRAAMPPLAETADVVAALQGIALCYALATDGATDLATHMEASQLGDGWCVRACVVLGAISEAVPLVERPAAWPPLAAKARPRARDGALGGWLASLDAMRPMLDVIRTCRELVDWHGANADRLPRFAPWVRDAVGLAAREAWSVFGAVVLPDEQQAADERRKSFRVVPGGRDG